MLSASLADNSHLLLKLSDLCRGYLRGFAPDLDGAITSVAAVAPTSPRARELFRLSDRFELLKASVHPQFRILSRVGASGIFSPRSRAVAVSLIWSFPAPVLSSSKSRRQSIVCYWSGPDSTTAMPANQEAVMICTFSGATIT